MKIRIKLRQTRLEKNLTQEQIAEIVGIDRSYYANIELGHKNPSFKVAIQIKNALNYYDDDIFLATECRNGTKHNISNSIISHTAKQKNL